MTRDFTGFPPRTSFLCKHYALMLVAAYLDSGQQFTETVFNRPPESSLPIME